MVEEMVNNQPNSPRILILQKTNQSTPCICKLQPPPQGCNFFPPRLMINLFVEAFITCEDTIQGNVVWNDFPIQGATVTFSAEPNIVIFSPMTTQTDQQGNFETTVIVPNGTPPTSITITATTTVNGQVLSTSLPTIVQCQQACVIDLFEHEPITCDGFVDGRVFCGGTLIEGAVVTLTSSPNILIFDPNPTVTDDAGTFFSGVSVPSGTPSQTVIITATTIVNGQVLSDSINVVVDCPPEACILTLTVPPNITCTGTITGNISCGGTGFEGAQIFFNSDPDILTFNMNPAISDPSGNFTTTVTVPNDTPLSSVDITATTTVNGQTLIFNAGTQVDCPPTPECPCKIFLNVQGGAAPATAHFTTSGGQSFDVTETINVTINQCFIAAIGCNPAVDNFNITFGRGSSPVKVNFTQGRRDEITCEDNTVATVIGTAQAQGFFDGIFSVTIRVTRDLLTNMATWEIFATDNMGNTFSTTFTAMLGANDFIGGCNEKG
jgi:hypothetical protein